MEIYHRFKFKPDTRFIKPEAVWVRQTELKIKRVSVVIKLFKKILNIFNTDTAADGFVGSVANDISSHFNIPY